MGDYSDEDEFFTDIGFPIHFTETTGGMLRGTARPIELMSSLQEELLASTGVISIMNREDIDYFIEQISERFIGRKVDFLEEMKNSHIGAGGRTSFSIVAPSFMLGPGILEIMKAAGETEISGASSQTSRGEPTEAVFTDFCGVNVLESGMWPTRLAGRPVCVHVYADDNAEFTFYYSKADSELLNPVLVELKSAIENLMWFKGKTVSFTSGRLAVITPPQTRMEDIVMDEKLRASIVDNTLYYLENMPAISAAGLSARRGVLLSGPPGNGKTLNCRAISNAAPVGTTTIWVTGASITSPKNITSLFKTTKKLSPCLLIIEDVDTLSGNREGGMYPTNPLLGELLSQMDGVGETTGVFIIATTNYPEQVDAALRDRPRRFDRHYNIPLPNEECRCTLLKRKLPASADVSESQARAIAVEMEGTSAAIIEEVVHTAQVRCLKNGGVVDYKVLIESLAEVRRHEKIHVASPELV